jgi:hypothetical protein
MLIETPYKNGDTISLKLSSGEEVVARLEEERDDSLKLTKPLMLTPTQEGLGLAPFMFTVNPEQSVVINRATVLCIAKTEDEMATQYVQNTTGIAV